MKKYIKLIVFLMIVIGIIYRHDLMNLVFDKVEVYYPVVEEMQGNIDKYYIYGSYFNIEGTINVDYDLESKYELVLKSEEDEIIFPLIINEIGDGFNFTVGTYINSGILLHNLVEGDFYILVKETYLEESKYYSLNNNTSYGDLEYYTITKNDSNNKIDIVFNDIYFKIKIKKTKLPDDVYDVVLGPGHGGNDPGALSLDGKYKEKDFNLDIAYMLKKELESLGLKVGVTRPEVEEKILYDFYGDEGCVVIPNKLHSKLSLSIHANSDIYPPVHGGVEIYAAYNSNLDYATSLANNIVKYAETDYSPKIKHRVKDGVYIKTFSEQDIQDTKNDLDRLGAAYYSNISTNTTFYFVIREVGGILTGAYVDGRNTNYKVNPYWNSNNVAEPYLIELGYMNDKKDLENLRFNKKGYVDGIAQSIKELWGL